MTLSPDDAAKALSEIAAAEQTSRTAFDDLISGASLILWGVIWVCCFSLIDLRPGLVQAIWLVGCSVGIAGNVVLGRRRHGREMRRWRAFIPTTSYVVFTFIALRILPPHRVEDASILVALVLALAYVQMGFFRGDRMMVVGVALAILALAGYAAMPLHFNLYMAIIGGGSLILAGFWLRRV